MWLGLALSGQVARGLILALMPAMTGLTLNSGPNSLSLSVTYFLAATDLHLELPAHVLGLLLVLLHFLLGLPHLLLEDIKEIAALHLSHVALSVFRTELTCGTQWSGARMVFTENCSELAAGELVQCQLALARTGAHCPAWPGPALPTSSYQPHSDLSYNLMSNPGAF